MLKILFFRQENRKRKTKFFKVDFFFLIDGSNGGVEKNNRVNFFCVFKKKSEVTGSN